MFPRPAPTLVFDVIPCWAGSYYPAVGWSLLGMDPMLPFRCKSWTRARYIHCLRLAFLSVLTVRNTGELGAHNGDDGTRCVYKRDGLVLDQSSRSFVLVPIIPALSFLIQTPSSPAATVAHHVSAQELPVGFCYRRVSLFVSAGRTVNRPS